MVSLPVKFNGKQYREVVFEKAFLVKKKRKRLNGVIFIGENNEVIVDKSLIRELSGIFYNMEQLLEDSFINGLEKTIATENDIKEEERRYRNIEKVLQGLIDKNSPGAEKVDGIIKKLPHFKKENNILIQQFIDVVKTLKPNEVINSDFLMNDIKQIYNLTLNKNFQKVKLISTGKNYYSSIKKEATGLYKKKMLGMMGSNISGAGANIDYVFSHLLQVVDVYSRIIDMSENDYAKYLGSVEKQGINELIEKNRAK